VKFKEKVTAAVLSGAGKEFQPLLEQIEADGNIPAIEIAAAIASLMQGTTPLLLTQKEEKPKAAPNLDGSVTTQTYRIEVGHAHGVLPGNIVGCIANEANIEGRHIGHIDIRDDHSYVDLPTLPDDMLSQLQTIKVRGTDLRIARVDSKPDKPKFSGKSQRPDRMAETAFSEGGRPERKPYMGGGSRYKKEGYKGTPRYADKVASLPAEFRDQERAPSQERPAFAPRERPAFGDKPSFGDKPRFGGKPGFKKEGFKPGGFKKDGFKPAGFKKKFTGKAAGAKGAYKGGKSFREKSR
jgi:hypothetical protein